MPIYKYFLLHLCNVFFASSMIFQKFQQNPAQSKRQKDTRRIYSKHPSFVSGYAPKCEYEMWDDTTPYYSYYLYGNLRGAMACIVRLADCRLNKSCVTLIIKSTCTGTLEVYLKDNGRVNSKLVGMAS